MPPLPTMNALKRIRQAIKNGELTLDREDIMPWTGLSGPDRLALYGRCKANCFMRPTLSKEEMIANPKKTLKFPICRVPKSSNECKISASGLLAASRRARLSKKWDDVVMETQILLKELGMTKKARAQMPVIAVRLRSVNEKPGYFRVTVTYEDGTHEILDKPLSKRVILKRYPYALSPTQLQKCMHA